MTDTEAKALALVNEIEQERGCQARTGEINRVLRFEEALCRAIEREEAIEARHVAELRELKERFSEPARTALIEALKADTYAIQRGASIGPILAPFILPAPDPLVEEEEDPIDALVDLLAPVLTHSQGMAARERENRFRNALAALKARGV